MFTYCFRAFSSDRSITCFRIKNRTVLIDGHLESAAFEIGNRVNEIVKINPYRHRRRRKARIARRHAKEEHFLPRGLNHFTEKVRKKSWQPRTAGKHKLVRTNSIAVL